jgi:hypothetical protein
MPPAMHAALYAIGEFINALVLSALVCGVWVGVITLLYIAWHKRPRVSMPDIARYAMAGAFIILCALFVLTSLVVFYSTKIGSTL